MNAIAQIIPPFSLRHHFIHSPQAERALARLGEVHGDTRRTGASKGLVIQGPSGVGKSTLIKEYVRELKATEPPGSGKRTVLVVEIPSSPTKKNLATAMLTALKDPYADARGHSAEVKFARIILLMTNLGVEVVVLDEAQHLVDYRRNDAYEAADWIKSLMNETSITFVLVGLKRTEGLLWANEQLRRRFSATVDYNRFSYAECTSAQFAMLLEVIANLLPVKAISFTEPQLLRRFAERPLQAGERLYLIVSAASDAEALKSLYQLEPATQVTPIWGGTPYAAWQPVMPYLTEIKSNSNFLPWIAETDAQDWGWLAVSTSAPDVVFEHLRSLTQVRMPDGTEVFFRFWDGRHIYPILEALGEAAGEVLPVFDRYLINGQSVEVGPRAVPPAKDWPWWEVPKGLLDGLAKQNQSTLIDNLMQWLGEERPDIYAAYPESNLKLKIARFVRRPDAPKNLNEALLNHLILEQG